MSLSIGIVGLPNVGKSTLFNALTKKSVPAENYPFCTIDPSVGVVAVPDPVLWKLSDFSKSAKTVPAVVEFVDIAGLVQGASEGEGLGNKFLSHIREVDAILEVVRIFEDDKIIHVRNTFDPRGDIDTINLELVLADLDTVKKRISNLQKDVKKSDKGAVAEHDILQKLQKHLEDGKLARNLPIKDEEKEILKSLHLLTMKTILYCLNKKAGGKNLDEIAGSSQPGSASGYTDKRFDELCQYIKSLGSDYVVVDAGIEHELKDLDGADKEVFRKDLGATDDGIDNLIKKGYQVLNLLTYYTTGEDETRAWTIQKGWNAPMAGTAIHNDFKDKFVRAEVIKWSDLIGAGSFAEARSRGLIRTEGKDYIVQEGDVVEFKI